MSSIMKFITTFVNKFKPKAAPMPQGRWRIEKCNVKRDKRVDLANEDHCGPCGQYALEKVRFITDTNSHIKVNHPNQN